MKKVHRIVDNIGCVVAWTVGLSLVGIALGIVVVRGMARETHKKASDAMRQTVHPTCTKVSCKFPWDVPKLSGDGEKPDRSDKK